MTDFLTKEVLQQRADALLAKMLGKLFVFEEYYDLYYLTGLKLSRGVLFVGSSIALFVDKRYEEIAKKNVHGLSMLYQIKLLAKYLQEQPVKTLYFDGSKTTYERYLFWQKLLQPLTMQAVAEENPLQRIRLIKSEEELALLEQSADLLTKGFMYLKTLLKEGVKESEVSKAFEIFCLEQGAQKLSFEPIIAFGENSAMPHYRSGSKRLKLPSIVLIDIGVIFNDYASDMTRTLFLGDVDPKLLEIYRIVKNTHEEVLKHVKAGASMKSLDKIARDFVQKQGDYPILHALGHGIGLEVHEYPRISIQASEDLLLQKNMVITIEPGLYIPGLGGVRYEDTVVVQENGFKNLYSNL